MLRLFLSVGIMALAFTTAHGVPAKDKEAWGEAAKPFQGRWTTSRDRKSDGKVRRHRLDLEFAGGKFTFTTFEEGDTKGQSFDLNVLWVERAEGASRLAVSARGKERQSVIYFAFQDDKLVLVGNCPATRPYESFPLSGEFKRVEKAK